MCFWNLERKLNTELRTQILVWIEIEKIECVNYLGSMVADEGGLHLVIADRGLSGFLKGRGSRVLFKEGVVTFVMRRNRNVWVEEWWCWMWRVREGKEDRSGDGQHEAWLEREESAVWGGASLWCLKATAQEHLPLRNTYRSGTPTGQEHLPLRNTYRSGTPTAQVHLPLVNVGEDSDEQEEEERVSKGSILIFYSMICTLNRNLFVVIRFRLTWYWGTNHDHMVSVARVVVNVAIWWVTSLCVSYSGSRGSSAVEYQTLNQVSPGSNPLCYCFVVWTFLFSPRCPSSLSCINENLAIDGGGNVSELS